MFSKYFSIFWHWMAFGGSLYSLQFCSSLLTEHSTVLGIQVQAHWSSRSAHLWNRTQTWKVDREETVAKDPGMLEDWWSDGKEFKWMWKWDMKSVLPLSVSLEIILETSTETKSPQNCPTILPTQKLNARRQIKFIWLCMWVMLCRVQNKVQDHPAPSPLKGRSEP